jgi:dihydroorotate dehydrogenase
MRILNASGCLDALAAPGVARQLDAFVTKTVTPLPREGSAPPRIAETAHGMLNSIGLANPGRERFLAEHLPRLCELGVPLWVSVGGFCSDDYAETCARLRREEVEAIELNLSCPNVDEAADSAAEIVAACRRATDLPLYAKSRRLRARSRRPVPTGSRSSTHCAPSLSTGDCARCSNAGAAVSRAPR